MKREIRILPRISGSKDDSIPIVRLGDVGVWSMVRRADFATAAPFVISRKTWDKCALKADQ